MFTSGSTGLHIERSKVPVPLATDILLLEAVDPASISAIGISLLSQVSL